MKKLLLLAILYFFTIQIFAQEPTGYYDDATGKTGAELKTALFGIISSHTALSYSALWSAYYNTDAKPNGKVWDMYSDVPGGTPPYEFTFGSGQCGNYSVEGDCYNREHSFPKSWFSEASPMVTDIFHIYPTDGKVNGQRSNYPYGEVSAPTWTSQNGSKLGPCTFDGYSGTVFEPIDEYKGDFARTYFYMATCYENKISNWSSAMLDGTSYPAFTTWAINLLLKWDCDDPVSQKEIDRNNEVYDNYQHNRNPFIDHPEFVNNIWGETSTPSISNVTISPENPKSSDEVTISADINDNGTISSAKTLWCTDGSSFDNNINMTISSGNTYQADTNIPAQEDGTTVYYKISATDDESNTSTTSNRSYIIQDNMPTTILLEDFASCPVSEWTIFSVTSNEDWTCGDGYLEANAYGGDVASNDWFISSSIDFNTYENEILTFQSYTQYTDDTHPKLSVKYSKDYTGSGDPSSYTWNNLTYTAPAENSLVWTNSGSIDISSIVDTAYIAFQYTSSGTGSNTSSLWRLDDIKITGKENTASAPTISNINISPETPTFNDDVDIFADITDDGTISSAKVLWCTNGTNFDNNINMSLSSGNTYQSDSKIPAQAESTTVYYKVQAVDNDNDTTISASNNYLIPSASAPTISNINISPETPTFNDDVDIFADITDDGTISSAKVLWCTNGTNFDNNINMSVSTENTYKSDSKIPAHAEGTTVYYKIEATDNEENTKTSTSLNYLIPSASAPNISNITTTPKKPSVDDAVDVFADITDNGTISSAKVLWCTDGTNFDNNIIMSVSTENTFKSDSKIPAQAEGITVYYRIEAVDNEDNKSTSASKNYTINLLEPIIIGENEICEGDSILFSLSQGSYESYKWRMQGSSAILGTDSTYYATLQGNYTVEVFKNELSATSNNFTLIVNNLPISDFSYSINNKTVSFTDKSSFGNSFFWNFDDGFTNKSQNPFHTFASYDTYKVVYRVTNSCGADSSYQNVFLQGNSISFAEQNKTIKLYPNPVHDILTLSTNNNNEKVEIYNIIGKKVLSFYKQQNNLQINVNVLNNGLYFIKICNFKSELKILSFIKE